MIYLVHYLDSQGQLTNVRVDADSRDEARLLSRIPERRIEMVREDIVGRISLALTPPGPPSNSQAVFMQTLSSSLSTGKTVKSALLSLVAEAKWLKYDEDKLDQCEELADYFRLFRFDKNAILLAQTATKTGKYVEVLQQASRYLLDQEKIKSEVSAELKMGITYIIIGTLFFLLVPLFIGASLEGIKTGSAAMFKPNAVTNALIAWGNMISAYWFVPVFVIPVVIWYRVILWQLIRGLPFLRVIHQKIKLSRSVRFVGSYRLLNDVGIVDSGAILSILQASSGEDAEVYKRMYAQLATSETLGATFDLQSWPVAVKETMSVFGEVDEAEKVKILRALEETLHMEHLHVSRTLSKTLARIGFVLMVSCVLAAIIGFYLPIVGGASGGRF
ncbi:MAG: type II secretion system F family protein [Pseudomonadales bacterium]|nr:type II secretion system F family protein [Pseudomonadales bacterium]